MRRADRLFLLIHALRGRRSAITAQSLAQTLDVSLRTVYRDVADLQRSGVPIEGEAGVGYLLRKGSDIPPLMFTPDELEALEAIVADHGLRLLRAQKPDRVTIDVDTTVTPAFGHQEGALPGSNPRYHGRPSYHPILARIAETDTVLGARLRSGDTALGESDVEDLEHWLDRAREAAGREAVITVRIDAGGDCCALLNAVHERGAFIVVKAKQTPNLLGAAMQVKRWHTVDIDADGKPSRQAAVIAYLGHRDQPSRTSGSRSRS